jgi:hypothetical protein
VELWGSSVWVAWHVLTSVWSVRRARVGNNKRYWPYVSMDPKPYVYHIVKPSLSRNDAGVLTHSK